MSKLADIARKEAAKCFHGYAVGIESNIDPIIEPFPQWSKEEADGLWCAAFVYYCCVKAGYNIPVRPQECISCNLACCGAWEEWAMSDKRIEYHKADNVFNPQKGDSVLFDRVFANLEHDHIGVVVDVKEDFIVVAEGNVNNASGIVQRKRDDAFCYSFVVIATKYDWR